MIPSENFFFFVTQFYSIIIFSLLINAVVLLLNYLILILYLYIHFLSFRHHFSLLKHYLDLYITDTVLKLSQPLYCFTTSVSRGVEKNFPRLWGLGISDAIFIKLYYDVYNFNWYSIALSYFPEILPMYAIKSF